MNESRRTLRYPFVANGQVIEEKSKAHLTVRVTELSLYGCYFDTLNPLPVGTPILVKIVTGLEFFEAQGIVRYSQPHRGMGVTFERVHPYFLTVLQGWLKEAEQKARLELPHE